LLFSLIAPPGWKDALIGALRRRRHPLRDCRGYYLWRREEGMGMGDVKMLAMIGAFLGWKAVLVTLVSVVVLRRVHRRGMMAVQRGSMKYALPFGTFLALGALAAMFVGDPLIAGMRGSCEFNPELRDHGPAGGPARHCDPVRRGPGEGDQGRQRSRRRPPRGGGRKRDAVDGRCRTP
jgi:hypothetical protein